MPTSTDYSKWDRIGDESDDDATASNDPSNASKYSSKAYSLMQASTWLIEAAPDISEEEATLLVRFIAAQDGQTASNSKEKRDAIVNIVDGAKRTPLSQDALLDLCLFAKERVDEAAKSVEEGGDVKEHAAASRVLMIATSALNTLSACRSQRSARTFFDALAADENSVNNTKDESSGLLAKKYETFGFATERLRVWDKGSTQKVSPNDSDGEADQALAAAKAEAQKMIPAPVSYKRIAAKIVEASSWHIMLIVAVLALRYAMVALWKTGNESREL